MKIEKPYFFLISFSSLGLESAEAVSLSIPLNPPSMVRHHSFENLLKKPEFARFIPQKSFRISYNYFYRSKEKLLFLIYISDPRVGPSREILEMVKELRKGELD